MCYHLLSVNNGTFWDINIRLTGSNLLALLSSGPRNPLRFSEWKGLREEILLGLPSVWSELWSRWLLLNISVIQALWLNDRASIFFYKCSGMVGKFPLTTLEGCCHWVIQSKVGFRTPEWQFTLSSDGAWCHIHAKVHLPMHTHCTHAHTEYT